MAMAHGGDNMQFEIGKLMSWCSISLPDALGKQISSCLAHIERRLVRAAAARPLHELEMIFRRLREYARTRDRCAGGQRHASRRQSRLPRLRPSS
eukprot:scaffold182736_cov28-Tisochrysis_lutea.AAC.2